MLFAINIIKKGEIFGKSRNADSSVEINFSELMKESHQQKYLRQAGCPKRKSNAQPACANIAVLGK